MSMNFEDKSGQPRNVQEVDEALAWCKKALVTMALPPDGMILMPTIIECLTAYRNVVARMKK